MELKSVIKKNKNNIEILYTRKINGITENWRTVINPNTGDTITPFGEVIPVPETIKRDWTAKDVTEYNRKKL